MRDFLFSEIASAHQLPNYPDFPDLAIEAGTHFCEKILEPLAATFGRPHIRSGFRSASLNAFGHKHGLKCGSNESNFAYHIWDQRDADGCMGAAACIVIPWMLDNRPGDRAWQGLAWWLADHLPFHSVTFFQRQTAFNIGWHERPKREIYSYLPPRGWLFRDVGRFLPGAHAGKYPGFPELAKP